MVGTEGGLDKDGLEAVDPEGAGHEASYDGGASETGARGDICDEVACDR